MEEKTVSYLSILPSMGHIKYSSIILSNMEVYVFISGADLGFSEGGGRELTSYRYTH